MNAAHMKECGAYKRMQISESLLIVSITLNVAFIDAVAMVTSYPWHLSLAIVRACSNLKLMGYVETFLARWQHHRFSPSRTQRRGGRSAFVNNGRTDGRIRTGPSPFDAPKHQHDDGMRHVALRATWRHVTHTIVVPALWRIEWAWSRPDPTIRSAAIDESAPPALPLRPARTESVVAPPVAKFVPNVTHWLVVVLI